MTSTVLPVLLVLALVGVLALLMWKVVWVSNRRRDLDREMEVPRAPRNQAFSYAGHILCPSAFSLFRGHLTTNSSGPTSRITKEDRARAYLQRILAVTGATHVDNTYVLNVGKVQFQIRDRFVRRLQNPKDPKAGFEETCFYLVHSGMPKAEEIATALLQLSKNPSLFDKWALQNGVAFKADGKVFERAQ